MNPCAEVGDKVFLVNVTLVYSIIPIQTTIFLKYRKRIAQIFIDISDLMENESNPVLKEYADPLFTRCEEIILKASQVSASMAVGNMFTIVLAPLLTGKYIFPAEFEFVTRINLNYEINFVLQAVGSLYVGVFFGFFSLIFIIFTIAILYELRLVAELCNFVGKYEQSIDAVKVAKTKVESLKSFNAAQLLKLIYEMHLKAIKTVEEINEIFKISILLWETVMTVASCMIYVLTLVDPARVLSFAPACTIASTQYLIVSLLSTLVKDALFDVGIKLYTSQWFLLSFNDRKSMMMILVMAQHSKTLTVGSFADASLERFTDVSLNSRDLK